MAEHAKPGVQEFKVPPRSYVIWIAILGLIPLLVIFRQNAAARRVPQLTQHEFIQKLGNNLIGHATITLDPDSPYLRDIRGRYLKTDPAGKTIIDHGKPVEVPFYAQVYLSDQTLQEL